MNEIKSYALSDDDINKILEPDTTIQRYRKLDTLNHIDDILDTKGRAVLLYNTTDDFNGHWVCLIKRGNKTIEFFDPYGYKPDTQQYQLGKNIDNRRYEQHDNDLTRLLKESKYRVYYNTYPFQDRDDVSLATCGRHCVMRLIHYKEALPKYYERISKAGLSADDWVSRETYKILHK